VFFSATKRGQLLHMAAGNRAKVFLPLGTLILHKCNIMMSAWCGKGKERPDNASLGKQTTFCNLLGLDLAVFSNFWKFVEKRKLDAAACD